MAEYDASNALQRRFVFDPTTGQPVVWYEGTGVASTDRRYLSTDERGSVISVSGSTGASLGLNTYDEYGKPGTSNLGRFQYTGQMWIPEAGLYDYKARDYLPQLGVFAQTDPLGYAVSLNLYVYTHDNPVGRVDPLGLDDLNCPPAQANNNKVAGPTTCKTLHGGILNGQNRLLINGPNPTLFQDIFGTYGYDSSGNVIYVSHWSFTIVSLTRGEGLAERLASDIKKALRGLYCAVAPHPDLTIQLSATAGFSGLDAGLTAGYSVAVDQSGSIEFFETDGGYRSIGLGGSLALTGGVSTAKKVGDLAGPFLTGSVTSAEAGGLTGSAFGGLSGDGPVVGAEAGLDIGFQDAAMFGQNTSTPIGGVSCP